ncbi:MAG: helix-turn-helix domain-containing protein [Lachnospiraceae bacterium]|nr:helix-turn-helix domain-containing protein [Lachnospiraceae bacterium]
MDHSLKIEDLAVLRDIAIDFGQMRGEYFVAYFRPADLSTDVMSMPTSIAGLTYCLLKKGRVTVNVDFKDVDMEPNSLMVTDTNSRFSLKALAEYGTEAFMMCFSPKFLHELNIDLHTLNLHEFVVNKPDAVTNLTSVEAHQIECLAQVLLNNAKYNKEPTFSLQIAKSATQALVYQQLQVFSSRRGNSLVNSEAAPGSRQLAYVQEFMRQLQLHHTHHRAVSFYADKLCISQKYLSHVIKEATGRSATDWIGEYVVMEAKNLLRFSNKNVQQVAYSLNFPTQSSFGKYFKHVTGISPSEFLKS